MSSVVFMPRPYRFLYGFDNDHKDAGAGSKIRGSAELLSEEKRSVLSSNVVKTLARFGYVKRTKGLARMS